MWLFFNLEAVKYFLKNEIYKVMKIIEVIIKKPITPVSVKISK